MSFSQELLRESCINIDEISLPGPEIPTPRERLSARPAVVQLVPVVGDGGRASIGVAAARLVAVGHATLAGNADGPQVQAGSSAFPVEDAAEIRTLIFSQ